MVPLEIADLCAHLRGPELLERAFEVLAGADGGASASAGLRPPLPLFAFLDPEAFVDIVPRMGLREAAHGEVVIREGDPGDSIFIIVAGRARVEREVRGEKRQLASLPGGSLFGELALLTGGRRSATVVADGEAEFFEIKAADLELVAHRFPEVPRDIARYAEKRVAANMLVTAGLFDNLLADQRAEVLEKFKPRFVAAGEKIVDETGGSQGLFLVMAGELAVTKRDPKGELVVLNLLRDGDVFGEISLLTGGPASATVTAQRKSIIAMLERADFDHLVQTRPAVADYLKALSDGRLKAIDDCMHPGEVLDADELIVE
jgi:CRP-like cAMP-binding protein